MDVDREVVTAHDVAREAGVSQSAVSRAFTPGASIASGTRTRIIEAAERLGYRPNPLARSMMRGRSGIVGVGVGDLSNPFFVETLQRLSEGLDKAGLRLMVFPAREGANGEPSIKEILHYRIEALVLLSVSLSSRLAEQCRRAQVPVIHYNRTTIEHDASSVVGDNEGGARAIAAHLLAGRHTRMAFMAGAEHSSTNALRQKGFLGYLREQNYVEPICVQGNYDFATSVEVTRKLLLSKNRPDALFCANDLMAIAAINVARYEFGLDVGREISIAGFDDIEMGQWPAFALTTFAQNAEVMVAETLRLILSLRTALDLHENVVTSGTLIMRGSTRPIRI